MLRLNNINVYYGDIHAVKNLSLEVRQSEIVSIIGTNGAGKTTTLKTISGLLKSKSGEILFLGQKIKNIYPEKIFKLGLAFVPEGRKIFGQMTVQENLEIGGYTKSNVKEKIFEIYKIFPRLEERKSQIAGTLSGGEQQMLAICRALMSEPKLLMLDEPSMGLSPVNTTKIFEIIQKLKNRGITILVVEQNVYHTLSISDRTYVLENGEIILCKNSSELINDSQIKEAYLGI